MAEGIEKFIRIDMTRFGAYSACRSPDVIARKLGLPEDEIIKLDANENPYGCSPKVKAALANYPYFHIYPDSAQTELLEDMARYVGLDKKYIVAGNGSDELIDLILRLFVSPKMKLLLLCPPLICTAFAPRFAAAR